MHKYLIKIILFFVPKRAWRQYLQANFDFFDIDTKTVQTKTYGRIYTPIYNRYAKLDGQEPQIYNADGKPLRTFFLRDKHFIAENPQVSKYFMFDRYDFGLPVHFYSHNAMRQIMGQPQKTYGLLVESKEIVPQDYRIFNNHPHLAQEFDAIFTFDEQILDKLPNAREFCFCAKINFFGANITPEDIEKCRFKTKNISICSSDKLICNLHKLRYDWAMQLKNNPAVDTFGTFDGGKLVAVMDYLCNYRYSVAVENAIQPYWFTEKILNCFATRTVPIYVGHKKMLERFNPDGIIFVEPTDYNHIEEIIKQCSEKDYLMRLPAIEDNFRRVQKYWRPFDFMWEQYLQKDLA